MRYLLDTGILLRLPHRNDPLHDLVRMALRQLTTDGHTLVTSTQNVAEFWNVSTRPSSARGGFGLSVTETHRRVSLLERFIKVLRESESTYSQWKRIVLLNRVMGRQVHDARLVALMRAHRINRILTLNDADFARYKGIQPLTPHAVTTGKY